MFGNVNGQRRLYGYIATAAFVVVALAITVSIRLSSSGPSAAERASSPEVEENPVVIENTMPGTSEWRLTKVANDAAQQIKGYASAASVDIGEKIDFFVTVNSAQTYSIDIYRFGYYQGTGARLVDHVDGLAGVKQPPCPMDPATGMISCNWSLGHSLTVPLTWTSGVFLAKLTNAEGFQNYITFTVRDDDRRSDLFYQQSVTTYQAYNNYPDDAPETSINAVTGKSLYDFNSSTTPTSLGTKRAVKVSYDRPYSDHGAGDFLDWESYFIRWMEQNGYDVTYATDIDTDLNGGRLRNHRGFLSVGHDEYWSKAMFDAAATARDNGVGLGFFGGNAVYWQIRFEPSSSGRPDRVQVCYKDGTLDPVKDATATLRWRDGGRSEQQMMGGMFISQQPASAAPAPYVVTNSSNWIYAGTGLRDGDSVPGIVGYEADRHQSGQPEPAAVAGTYVQLSHSPFTTTEATTEYQQSMVYQAPSGAWVFDAGTIKWSWGLYSDEQKYADPRIQRLTANMLDKFIAGPGPAPSASTSRAATAGTAGATVWMTAGNLRRRERRRRDHPDLSETIGTASLPAEVFT